MPLIDARPDSVDQLIRPGVTYTLTLPWPAGELTGRTFTSSLDGVALAVTVDGDTMTVEATDTITGALAVGVPVQWLLLEDIDGTDEPILVGTWTPSDSPRAVSSSTVTVATDGTTVQVTVNSAQASITALDTRTTTLEAARPRLVEWRESDGWDAWTEVNVSEVVPGDIALTVSGGVGTATGVGADGNDRRLFISDALPSGVADVEIYADFTLGKQVGLVMRYQSTGVSTGVAVIVWSNILFAVNGNVLLGVWEFDGTNAGLIGLLNQSATSLSGFVSPVLSASGDGTTVTVKTRRSHELVVGNIIVLEDVGPSKLVLPGTSGAYASTPDAAALDVAGDLDVRVDVSMDDWTPVADQTLAAKYEPTGNQRSWQLQVTTTGNVRLQHSADGSTSSVYSTTGAVLAGLDDGARQAVRVTLDVDDDAGGRTYTTYTAPTIDGLWTQVHTDTEAGTTSLFASTAALAVGAQSNGTSQPAAGDVHVVELRDGIDGTVVAGPDFTGHTDGTTSFVDDAGNTWTVNGDATIDVAGFGQKTVATIPDATTFTFADTAVGSWTGGTWRWVIHSGRRKLAARLVGDRVTWKQWLPSEAEPSWADPDRAVSALLPATLDGSGLPPPSDGGVGFLVAHLDAAGAVSVNDFAVRVLD